MPSTTAASPPTGPTSGPIPARSASSSGDARRRARTRLPAQPRDGPPGQGRAVAPEDDAGSRLCAAAGVAGAAGAVALWVLTTSESSFPYSGGFFLIGLAVAGVILAAVAVPRSMVPRRCRWLRCATWAASPTASTSGTGPSSSGSTTRGTGLDGYELFAVRVLVTFAVSVVSFHLIERPIRMGTFVSQWRAWLVVPAGVGAVLVAVVAATTGTTAVATTSNIYYGK